MKWYLLFLLTAFFCWPAVGHPQNGGKNKVNGISIWSDVAPSTPKDFEFVEATNANWISLQPYGVVMTDTTGVEFNRTDIWECSSFEGLIKNITTAHELGYYVFIKPHIIVKYDGAGIWSGNLKLNTEEKWNIYENSYSRYVLALAQISDSLNVEMLSLGTELGNFPHKRTAVWKQLIADVRSVYSGALTYCANFDAYTKFPFWKEMDLIGIDAYFTVDHSRKTSLDKCREGWKPIAKKLKAYSELLGKKILFTEFGYTSTDYCGNKPFGGHGSAEVNLVAQANAYRAVFDTFWDEPWFAGGFSWVWHFNYTEPEFYDNTSFSPQNKPAANIIAKQFLLHR